MCFWSYFQSTLEPDKILQRIICTLCSGLSGGKRRFQLSLWYIHRHWLSTLFSLLYYHSSLKDILLCILFTFNNNKINIGWMRNGLQTYKHMCLIQPPRFGWESIFVFINRWDFAFYAFDKFRRCRWVGGGENRNSHKKSINRPANVRNKRLSKP